MKTIPETFDESHVRANVFYAKAADSKIYNEASYTTQADEAEVMNAFQKGMLVLFDGANYFKAVKAVGEKFYTVDVAESAVTLVEWSAKAAE